MNALTFSLPGASSKLGWLGATIVPRVCLQTRGALTRRTEEGNLRRPNTCTTPYKGGIRGRGREWNNLVWTRRRSHKRLPLQFCERGDNDTAPHAPGSTLCETCTSLERHCLILPIRPARVSCFVAQASQRFVSSMSKCSRLNQYRKVNPFALLFARR